MCVYIEKLVFHLFYFLLFSLKCFGHLMKFISSIHVKPERKRVRKCRGGRRKNRKIKVLTISRHQNRYSGQIGYNPGNLIEINIINNTGLQSFLIKHLNRWSRLYFLH